MLCNRISHVVGAKLNASSFCKAELGMGKSLLLHDRVTHVVLDGQPKRRLLVSVLQ